MRYFKEHKIVSFVLVIITFYIYINYTIVFDNNSTWNRDNYTNGIYYSNQRVYNQFLNSDEKKAYDDLMNYINKRQLKVMVDLSKYDNKKPEVVANYYAVAHEAITLDHPELLQVGYISWQYNNEDLKITIFYAIDNKIKEEINTLKIRKIINDIKLKTINMNDLDKIKYVYDWIGSNTVYDSTFTYFAKNQSIYNVFIKKNAVCAGFAKASQVIFQNIGIDSILVSGESTGPHMWNIIKYNNKYYYYDSTWAASIKNKSNEYYYGGLKQEEMNYYTTDFNWYPEVEKTNALFNK